MRSVLLSLALVFLLGAVAHAELPKNLEEFQAQVAEKATDPKGGSDSVVYRSLHLPV